MKRLLLLFALSCIVPFSCEKPDDTEPVEHTKDELVYKGVTVRLGKLNTKMSISENSSPYWTKGDSVFYVNPATGIVRTAKVYSNGGVVSLPLEVESSCKNVLAVYGCTGMSKVNDKYTVNTVSPLFAGILDTESSEEQVIYPIFAFIRFSCGKNGVRSLTFRSNDGTPVCGTGGDIGLNLKNGGLSVDVPNACDSISVSVTDDDTFFYGALPCKLSKGYSINAYDDSGTLIARGSSSESISLEAGDLLELGSLEDILVPADGHYEFNWDGKNYYVTQTGAGKKNGKTWENAMSASELSALLRSGTITEDVSVHMAEGEYNINVSIDTGSYSCHFKGGYPQGLHNGDTDCRDIHNNKTLVTGNNSGRIMYISAPLKFVFDGIDFAYANGASNYGGVVYLNNPEALFQVDNACFYSNYAYRGGALFVSSGKAAFHNCIFENNSAHDRGAVFNASSSEAFLYFNKCAFISNYLDGGEWGTVSSCNSQSVVAMNNCVSHGNYSTVSSNDPTFNGQYHFSVSNCTFIEETKLRGVIRVENDAEGRIINSIVINTADSKPAITMNNQKYRLNSYGHNILGSVDGSGEQAFQPHRSDLQNVASINAVWDERDNNYHWDDQPAGFDPATPEQLRQALSQDFLNWLDEVDPEALTTDYNGNRRETDYLRPGAYEGTHISPSADILIKSSTTSYAMLREAVRLSFFNIYQATDVSVDWGDGSASNEKLNANGVLSHEFIAPGVYSITAKAGGVSASFEITVSSLLSLDKAMAELHDGNKCWVMTHRAHTTDWSIPENSVSAVNASIAAGAEFIETDTQITSDGVVVVCHDQTINSTTNGTGDIPSLTLSKIKSYYMKDRNGRVTSEKMPTLEEFLLAARGKVYVNLDYSPRTASTAQVMEVVDKLGMNGQVLYYCNSEEKVDEVLSLNPDAQVYFNHSIYRKMAGKGPYCIQAIWGNTLTPSSGTAVNAKNAHNAGMVVTVCLLNVLADYIPAKSIDPSQVNSIFNVFPACKMIMTDCPEELIEVLASKGKR